jgi:hypothetical protein
VKWPLAGELVTCQLRVEFCTGGCEAGIREREVEEFPLLEAVVRERLVETQQAGKDLAGTVVICKYGY